MIRDEIGGRIRRGKVRRRDRQTDNTWLKNNRDRVRLNAWTCLQAAGTSAQPFSLSLRRLQLLLSAPSSLSRSSSSASVSRLLLQPRWQKKRRRAERTFVVGLMFVLVRASSTSLTERERERDTTGRRHADRFSRTKLGSVPLGALRFFFHGSGESETISRHEFSAKSIIERIKNDGGKMSEAPQRRICRVLSSTLAGDLHRLRNAEICITSKPTGNI